MCVIWGRDRPPTFRTTFQGFRCCSRFLTAKTGSVKFLALCNLKVQNSFSLLSPSTGCHRFADCARVFSGTTVTHFWGRGRASCLVTRDDVISPLEAVIQLCVWLRASEHHSVLRLHLSLTAVSSWMWLSVHWQCLPLAHQSLRPPSVCRTALERQKIDQGGQTVTRNYTHAEAAITLALMPVTQYSLLKILGNGS